MFMTHKMQGFRVLNMTKSFRTFVWSILDLFCSTSAVMPEPIVMKTLKIRGMDE